MIYTCYVVKFHFRYETSVELFYLRPSVVIWRIEIWSAKRDCNMDRQNCNIDRQNQQVDP